MTAPSRIPAPREPIGPARWYRLRELLDHVADDDPRHERDIAAGMVDDLDADDLRALALETVEACIWDRRRARQARIERHAAQEAREARSRAEDAQRRAILTRQRESRHSRFARLLADPGLMYAPAAARGTSVWLGRREDREAFRSWAGDRFPDWHVRARAVVEAHPNTPGAGLFGEDWDPEGPSAYRRREATRRMIELVQVTAEETELRVTAELLGSEFALGDGRRVTWGQATVADHEQRVALLTRNATANAEAAARHLAAVEMLRGHGVGTLAELAASDEPAVAS